VLLAALITLAGIAVSSCGGGSAPSTQTPSPKEAGTASEAANMDVGLYIIDEQGEEKPVQIVDFPTRAPRWTPTGDGLFFMGDTSGLHGQDPPNVYSCSATGEGLMNLLETSRDPSTFSLWHTFSPDLSMVAYVTNASRVIRIADLADPTSDREVADGMLGEWSPDGAFLSYLSPACGAFSLFVTTPAGEQTLVAPYAEGSPISWSTWLPGSSKLAYLRMAKTESGLVPDRLAAFDVRTHQTTDVPELAGVDVEPIFSPDGSWFVYADQGKDTAGMYLVRWGEGAPTRIGDYFSWDPAWAPQSDKIALVEDGKIRVYNVADGTDHVIDLHLKALPEGADFWLVEVSWSPDGKKLAVAVRNGVGRGFCD